MRINSPRNALAFLGDKLQVGAYRYYTSRFDVRTGIPAERIPLHTIDASTDLQAKRDKVFLEDYRRQAHEALARDPYSTSFSEDPEIVHKNPVVRSTIKYKNQSPGDGSSFSASNQVNY